MSNEIEKNEPVVEIRTYLLQKGTRMDYHLLFTESVIPLLLKWNFNVLYFGHSLHDEDSYILIRKFNNLAELNLMVDNFYNSSDWKKGPREEVVAKIEYYTTVVLSEKQFSKLFK